MIFPYNTYFTGDPFLAAVNQYSADYFGPGANRFGFGPDIGTSEVWGRIDLYPGHSFGEALINLQHNAYTLNFELFGWAFGSLSLFLVHLLWGRWTKIDAFMLLIIAIVVCAYSLYWFNGSYYIGPRYWFMVFLPFVVITASGIVTLGLKLQSLPGTNLTAERMGLTISVFAAMALVSFSSWKGVEKYHEFRGYHSDYRDLVRDNRLDGGVVFVKTDSEAESGSALFLNSPDLDGSTPLFVRDLGAQSNRAIADLYPDRPYFFVSGRNDDVEQASLVAGPRSTIPEP